MAENDNNLIRFLTYKLSYDLANQIYKEYESRMKEVDFLLENSQRFLPLRNNRKSIELLLAASIFHKRVISNLDSATKFFNRVTGDGEADSVKIGGYIMTGKERNKMLGVILNFNRIVNAYNIPISFMDYYTTRDFMIKALRLKNADAENNN